MMQIFLACTVLKRPKRDESNFDTHTQVFCWIISFTLKKWVKEVEKVSRRGLHNDLSSPWKAITTSESILGRNVFSLYIPSGSEKNRGQKVGGKETEKKERSEEEIISNFLISSTLLRLLRKCGSGKAEWEKDFFNPRQFVYKCFS